MREWKSKINGSQLREEIKNGNSFEILKVLKSDLYFKINRIKDVHEKYEFEDLYELVKSDVDMGEVELIKYVKDENWNMTDLVDDRLHQFYDMCDKYDVWVTV